MMRIRALGVGVSSVALIWACGGSTGTGFDGGIGGNDSGGPDDVTTEPPVFGDSSPPSDSGPPPVDASDDCCPANAQYIYVTGPSAKLYSFWPPTFTFKLVGTLSCTTFPTHMTVDRNGTAWVVGDGGSVYKTSTLNAQCSALGTWTPQNGFDDFALSFTGLTCDDTSLFMLGQSSGELAKFDTAKSTFTKIGTPNVAGILGDMTTNGDGTLYFLNDAPTLHLYDINPATAAVKKTYTIPNASGGGNQALAYFGGRFYAFEEDVVYEYDPVANTTKNIGTAPISITGAGQSTCVPSAPTDAGPPPVN
ncbi:MAG TPA: hypothetical protein VGH28_33735 [Polyangiaceae bacterium]|jgi:hypothetical protein